MTNTTTSLPYTIVPLRPAFLAKARGTGLDDQEQAVEHHIASGGEPCRDVLRRAVAGEAILLASYCPFEQASPYREYGPVFVMAEANPQAPMSNSLAALLDIGYLGAQFVLRAYSTAERIVDGMVVLRTEAEAALQTLLRRPEVQFVLVRFAGYGCYACRIERA